MLQVVEDVRGNMLIYTSNTTELNVDGLTPFTEYSVQVVAVNSVGFSALSEPMIVMTAEGSESTYSALYVQIHFGCSSTCACHCVPLVPTSDNHYVYMNNLMKVASQDFQFLTCSFEF